MKFFASRNTTLSCSIKLNCGFNIPNVTTCPGVNKLFSSCNSGLAIKNSCVDILFLNATSAIVSPALITYVFCLSVVPKSSY